MKLLIIDVTWKVGSTGKIVNSLARYFLRQGDDVVVCYGRGAGTTDIGVYKFGYDIETWIHALLTRLTGFTGCFSFFSTRKLIRIIRKYQPDVISIHELHAYFVNFKQLIRFIKKENIPTVLTLHCEFDYTGKCGYAANCNLWKTECHNCPNLHSYPKSWIFDHTRFMFRRKKELFSHFPRLRIVSPSLWLAERAQQSFLSAYPISVINNGIDVSIYKRAAALSELRKKHSIMPHEKVVLAVAPDLMSERKGGDYVLRLAKMCQEDIKFILIGVDGCDCNEVGNVILLGQIKDKAKLVDYYSLADAFVICSKNENFPTTCLESQCCGTPVFGFATGGTAETGLLGKDYFCEFGDLEALYSIMLKTLSLNETIRKKLMETAHQEFSEDKMSASYYELIHNQG